MNWLRGFIAAADTAEGGTSIDHDFNKLLLGYLSLLEVLGQQHQKGIGGTWVFNQGDVLLWRLGFARDLVHLLQDQN